MNVSTPFGFTEEETPEAAALLNASGVIDAAFYREQAGLPQHADAALHYLQAGWRHGLEPNKGFNGDFLQPFYAACGYGGPPALTWAELCLLGGAELPTNAQSAEAVAAQLRSIPLFDAVYYALRLPAGLDPVLHYVLIGERLGWRPFSDFDTEFYAETYPDVVEAGISPLVHYWSNGKQEGRSHVAAADRLEFPPLPIGDDRPVVLVVSHEASRTGAPILGLNIIKHLSRDYRIVSLLMHHGILESDFAAISSAQVGPMRHNEWRSSQAQRMAARLVERYRPIYAVTNSVETHLMVPALAKMGVPSVALVHEFMSYTGQAQEKMNNLFDWSPSVVFPARTVAQSSFDRFDRLEHRRGIVVRPQGQAELPPSRSGQPEDTEERANSLRKALRPEGCEDVFLVLGIGTVEIRKGVDLFISTAAALRRINSKIPCRFAWIGGGFDPRRDMAFSSFLADQISRSGLEGTVVMLDPVNDLEPAYQEADVLFMCSRLDPQPNVGIDALTRGIPTVCFKDASGTGEILASDPATQHLVVPYLDVQAAASLILDLASRPDQILQLRRDVARLGRQTFDMANYAAMLDCLGQKALREENETDVIELIRSGILDTDMICRPGLEIIEDKEELARYAMRQWSLWNMLETPDVSTPMRRPLTGFHPQAYARAHPELNKPDGSNPVVHWLRNGQRDGSWSHPVYSPSSTPVEVSGKANVRAALHGHFFYTDDAADLASRLSHNNVSCDLFLTTGTKEDCDVLREAFQDHRGSIDVRIVPNRGRDIGPFLDALNSLITANYDLIGHVHGKKTLVVGGDTGDRWRTFLWENLIGGQHSMLDLAASAFAADPELGLLMAEDPHLVGWDKNRNAANVLAERMGLSVPLDDFFDFPLGTMFWARPAALKPLLDLRLTWNDYPEEPVPYDGTILHAIERLLPFVARHSGYGIAGLHVPGTTW